jgi:2-oxoglutarate ferredoxin oxidoreductase subunit delta
LRICKAPQTPFMEATTAKPRKVKGRVEIEVQRCKGCELCTIECRENALTLSDSINFKGYRYAVVNNDLCTGCVNCALVCPDAVISVYRTPVKKKTVLTDIRDEIQHTVLGPIN